MATKYTTDQLKALKAPELRVAAREWGVPVAGKKPADIIRAIQAKQGGGVTAATASSKTAIPGKNQISKGSLTAKPKTPTPVARAVAAAPKPVGKPVGKPVPTPIKTANGTQPTARPAPKPINPGVKPASPEVESKFKALMEQHFGELIAPFQAQYEELAGNFSHLHDEFEELKRLAQTAVASDPTEPNEDVPEEAAAEEGQVELTQEQIEGMDVDQLVELAGQVGVEIEEGDTDVSLRTRILTHLTEGAVSDEAPPEDREEVVDLSWVKKGVNCLVLHENEWKEGAIVSINAKTQVIKAFVWDPSDEKGETGWELTPAPNEIQPLPAEGEGEGEAAAEAAE